MSPSVIDHLHYILDELGYLAAQVNDLQYDEFMKNATLQRAFIRSWEVIDEAAKQVPGELRHKYPGIEWRAITGMRDRLIHGYFSVDYALVWDAATNKAPKLQQRIEQMLADLDKS